MLFSRVYSWIKFKALPPSVLALNRIFVERNSKHRRVLSNLGLTFRNSKWSTYARHNINASSVKRYASLASRLVSFFLITFFVHSALYPITSFAAPLCWFVTDADLYLKAAASSSLFYAIQTSRLVLPNVSSKPSKQRAKRSTTWTSKKQNRVLRFPQRLHKPLLYVWLAGPAGSPSASDLFSRNPDALTGALLLRELYRVVGLLQASTSSVGALGASVAALQNSRPSAALLHGHQSALPQPVLNSLVADYVHSAHYPLPSRSGLGADLSYWALGDTHNESNGLKCPLSCESGLFYLPNLQYSQLQNSVQLLPELEAVKGSLENQPRAIRWNRWLYKYNLLHRASLKNALYINSAKRLLGSGFYNHDMGARNVWAAATLTNRSLDGSQLSSVHSALYGNYWTLPESKSLPHFSTFCNTSFPAALSSYESSYHWYLQRFFQMGTLPTNVVTTGPVPTLTRLYPELEQNLAYVQGRFTSSLVSSVRLPQPGLRDFSRSTQTASYPIKLGSKTAAHLDYSHRFLLHKERLEALQSITSNRSRAGVLAHTPTLHVCFATPENEILQ